MDTGALGLLRSQPFRSGQLQVLEAIERNRLLTNLLHSCYRRRLLEANIKCICNLEQDWLDVVQVRHGDRAGLGNE